MSGFLFNDISLVTDLTSESISSNISANVTSTLTTTSNLSCNTYTDVTTLGASLDLEIPINAPTGLVSNMTTSNIAAAHGYSMTQGPYYFVHPIKDVAIRWEGFTFSPTTQVPTHTASVVSVLVDAVPEGSATITHTAGTSDYHLFDTEFSTNTDQVVTIQARRTNGSDGTEAFVFLQGQIDLF